MPIDGVEIKGLVETQKKLEQVAADVAGEPVRQAVREGTLMIQRTAKEEVAVDTGRLRGSITSRVIGDEKSITGITGTNVKYAADQEFGRGPHSPDQGSLGLWAKRHGIPLQPLVEHIEQYGTRAAVYDASSQGQRERRQKEDRRRRERDRQQMSLITYGSLCKAVASALSAVSGVATVQAYDEITESISDTPTLQVYFENAVTDDLGQVDRSAFGAGVRATRLVITIDCYARQTSHVAEDLAAQIDIMDAVDQVLALQTTQPFFGGAQALHWSWKKAILESADAKYAGAECTLTLWIF